MRSKSHPKSKDDKRPTSKPKVKPRAKRKSGNDEDVNKLIWALLLSDPE